VEQKAKSKQNVLVLFALYVSPCRVPKKSLATTLQTDIFSVFFLKKFPSFPSSDDEGKTIFQCEDDAFKGGAYRYDQYCRR
jgi:hypothetical protein